MSSIGTIRSKGEAGSDWRVSLPNFIVSGKLFTAAISLSSSAMLIGGGHVRIVGMTACSLGLVF